MTTCLLLLTVLSFLLGGLAGAASKITGAMAKGVAAITMDEDYQQQRREAMNRQPTGLREGLTRGGKGLVSVRNLRCGRYREQVLNRHSVSKLAQLLLLKLLLGCCKSSEYKTYQRSPKTILFT